MKLWDFTLKGNTGTRLYVFYKENNVRSCSSQIALGGRHGKKERKERKKGKERK
tara:strand:+ start:170 stop:331 length:162 start_codon:yes stop_codon:yes gene_type:complete